MANLRPDVMQKFMSILESQNEDIVTLLHDTGWGNSKVEINVNAELYAYPEPSSPAEGVIDRIFMTPRMSKVLRVRIAVVNDSLVPSVRKCMGAVVPKLTAGGQGIDDLGKSFVEYEVSLPSSFMVSKTPEQDFKSVVTPVITALRSLYE